MVRNPVKRVEEEPQAQQPAQPEAPVNRIVEEREITLSLINDKLNFLTNVVLKIAEACDVDLRKL